MGNKSKGRSVAEAAAAPAGTNGFSLISNDKLLALYANLLKCRMVAAKQADPNGRSRSLKGCEAGTVGATIDLGSEDIVSSADATWLPEFLKAASIETALHAFSVNGRPHCESANSRNGVGRRIETKQTSSLQEPMHAVIGAALANKTEKNGKIAVVFNFDDAGEAWDQAIQIATLHGLPIIFISQQNGKSARASKWRSEPSSKNLHSANQHFPSIKVDSHDVVAVYRVASEAISRARHGRGPTLIECEPFRVNYGKSANGNSTQSGHTFDSVRNMENYLGNKGLLNRKVKSEMIAKVAEELNTPA